MLRGKYPGDDLRRYERDRAEKHGPPALKPADGRPQISPGASAVTLRWPREGPAWVEALQSFTGLAHVRILVGLVMIRALLHR